MRRGAAGDARAREATAMSERLWLRRNAAPWDRLLRLLVGAALLVAGPQLLRSPYLLLADGLVAGLQMQAALTGY